MRSNVQTTYFSISFAMHRTIERPYFFQVLFKVTVLYLLLLSEGRLDAMVFPNKIDLI